MGLFSSRNTEIEFIPPTNQSPLVVRHFFKKLFVYPDNFTFKKRIYSYDTIRNICFAWVEKYINGIPSGATIVFGLLLNPPHKKILLQLASDSRRSSKISDAYNAFRYISSKTYDSRLQRYINSIKSNGYFDYIYLTPRYRLKTCRFFTDGLVEINRKSFNINEVKLNSIPLFLEFIFTEGIFGKKICLSTAVDRDIFYALIEELYNISWTE